MPAVAAWQQAGEQAATRSALVEAVEHYNRALEVLGTLPDTPARAQQELALQVALGHALFVTKGWASREGAEAFARVRELSEQLGDTQQILLVLLGLWVSAYTRGEARAAQELADQMLRVAERDSTPGTLVWAHVAQGATRYERGDLIAAREHLERAIAVYDEEEYRSGLPDPGCTGHFLRALAAWQLGLPDEARQRIREALDHAQRLEKAYDLALTQFAAASLHVYLRESHGVLKYAEPLLQLATEQQFALFHAWASILRGWALAEQGRHDEGIAELRQALAEYLATGQRTAHGQNLGLLADAYLKAGADAEGLAAVEDALGAVPEEELHIPELLRLRGDLLARAGADPHGVEASYRDAIAVARRLGAKSYELRATTSLGRLLQLQARAAEARDLLAPLYAGFTEGFDTRDLREAKALLADLG